MPKYADFELDLQTSKDELKQFISTEHPDKPKTKWDCPVSQNIYILCPYSEYKTCDQRE